MINGIYFSEGLDFSDINNIGIENKVLAQVSCLEKLGNLSFINNEFNRDDKIDMIKFILPFIASKREKGRIRLLKNVSIDTDYLYIRKPSLSYSFFLLLNEVKEINPAIKIIMEIPTYPFHNEYSGFSRLMIVPSIACEKKLHQIVDYIVTYSSDDYIWGIKTLKMSNCVDYASINSRNNYSAIPKTIRLTCVANYMYWHGLDRLINGIKNYNGDYDVMLNVVGGGKEIPNLKKIADKDKRIHFYGPLTGDKLDRVFDNTDVAIDALGRHRSGVIYNSSLKGKEYLARGIPVLSGVETELDHIDGFKFYFRVPADDSDIDIYSVISFFESICKDDSITETIISTTKPLFDYNSGFLKIIQGLFDD